VIATKLHIKGRKCGETGSKTKGKGIGEKKHWFNGTMLDWTDKKYGGQPHERGA
jgi:hypothetical protein